MRIWLLTGLFAGLGLLALACQSGTPAAQPATIAQESASPTAVPEPSPTLQPAPSPTQETQAATQLLSTGHELFVAKGCAACHGQNAEGTDIAPALAGHSEAQVMRQARAPLGIMPVFPPDKISNEELQEIAEYIGSIEGGHGHMRTGASGDEVVLHHWMSLFAIEADDADEAMHHVNHIIDLTQGEHQAKMKESLELIEQGDIHDAAHIIEEMLAGLEPSGINEATMHLMLALSAARVEDTDNAMHQMEHFLDLASESDHERGEHILEAIMQSRIHDAEHELEEMLGGMVAEDDHMQDEADAHDDMQDDMHDEADTHDDSGMPGETEMHDEGEAHDETNSN